MEDFHYVCFEASLKWRMVLDIDLFREEKGGTPELIRESQRKRYKDVKFVDDVISYDQQWRKGSIFRFGNL